MIQVCTEVSVSVCPTHTVFYINFCHCWQSITEPGMDSPAQTELSWSREVWSKEEKKCCNHVESKREVTDYKYSSFRIVLKYLGRNFSKNPYSCLPWVTSHTKWNVFTYTKGIWMLSTLSCSPPLPPTIFQLSLWVEISVTGPVSKGSHVWVSRCPQASAELGHWNLLRQVTPTNGIWVLSVLQFAEVQLLALLFAQNICPKAVLMNR